MRPDLHPVRTLRKFPARAVWIYLAAHVLVGQVVALGSFGDSESLRQFFLPIDAVFPTFRTWFVQSVDPIGCKLMLLLWWIFFLPWGLVWLGRFTGGFKVSNPQAISSPGSVVKFLIIGLFFSLLIAYGHSLMDQSLNLASASRKSGISSVIPTVIHLGPGYFAIYLAAASLLAVVASGLVLMLMRKVLLQK